MEGPSSSTNFESQFIFLKVSISCPTEFSNGKKVERVTLRFPETVNSIFVKLPVKTSSANSERLKFTCIKPAGVETNPDTLKVTIGKVYKLVLGIEYRLESTDALTNQTDLRLTVGGELVPNKTYTLNFTSLDESSPSLEFEEEQEHCAEGNHQLLAAELAKQFKKIDFAASKSTSGEERAGVLGSVFGDLSAVATNLNPHIKETTDEPSRFTTEYLMHLPVADLKKMFEEAHIRDKKLAIMRLNAASSGEIAVMNKTTQKEKNNSELIMRLSWVLEQRGFTPYLPATDEYRDLVRQEQNILAAQLASCSIQ